MVQYSQNRTVFNNKTTVKYNNMDKPYPQNMAQQESNTKITTNNSIDIKVKTEETNF